MLSPNRNGFHGKPEPLQPETHGAIPKDESELLERIESVSACLKIEEYKVPFEITRMLKGYFACNYDAAFAFVERIDQDLFSTDQLLSQWDRVDIPCWYFESMAKRFPETWEHPNLNLRNKRSKARTLAGMAYWLQDGDAEKEFHLGQIQVGKALNITHQTAFALIRLLVECGWLTRRKVGARHVLYRCAQSVLDNAE